MDRGSIFEIKAGVSERKHLYRTISLDIPRDMLSPLSPLCIHVHILQRDREIYCETAMGFYE
jgi:hypothetical protein